MLTYILFTIRIEYRNIFLIIYYMLFTYHV